MKGMECVKREILSIIDRSPVEEDPAHARNTFEWVKRLDPACSPAMEIAALGHDIDRAIPERKVRREDFQDYDSFKKAHAENSARILREIMEKCRIEDETFINRVVELVEKHEFGGTPEADILKDADGISFFDVNLPLYYKRNGYDETLRRCTWSYRRLSERTRKIVKNLPFRDQDIKEIVQKIINQEIH